jgi:hypothetical protein
MGTCISICVLQLDRHRVRRPTIQTKPDPSYDVYTHIAERDMVSECVICIEDMKAGENLSILRCGHMFHNQCALTWFNRKKVCPYCETPV